MFELLEPRRFFSATLTDTGTIQVGGTEGDDNLRIWQRGATVVVRDNRQVSRFAAVDVRLVNVLGLDGDDRIDCRGVRVPCQITGHAGNDLLLGGRGNDRISGNEGRDKLHGLGGNDELIDAAGDDLLVGGPGDDALTDYSGSNRFLGGSGSDTGSHVDGTTRLAGVEATSLLAPPIAVVLHPAFVTAAVEPDDTGAWYANVTVSLPGSNYAAGFGSLTRSGNQFTLPINIERFSTGGVDLIIEVREAFPLGPVKGGNYDLVITSADVVVKTISFAVPIPTRTA